MSWVTSCFIKDGIKKRQKNYLYRRQINVLAHVDGGIKKKKLLLEFNYLADQRKSLIDVFLHFFDSIYEDQVSSTKEFIKGSLKYNKIFAFFLRVYFLHDKFLPLMFKTTEEEISTHNDIVGSYTMSQSMDKQLRLYWNTIKQEMNEKFNHLLNQRSRFNEKSDQVFKYEVSLSIISSQKQKTIDQIVNIKQQTIRSKYISKQMQGIQKTYLERLLQTLASIKFTKKVYRFAKFLDFVQKTYKDYYKIECKEIINFRNSANYLNKIVINTYTNNSKEYLIDVFNLIHIRKKDIKYEPQSFEISKHLLKELSKHQALTKRPYPLLSAKSVIFNQLSLKTQLNYENPLHQALGLLKKPANIENNICFMSTPRSFDTYATIEELRNPDLLTNHLIGVDSIINRQNQRDDFNDKQGGQSLKKLQLMTAIKSQSWRYMMTVYFIMNGEEYYQRDKQKKIERTNQFHQFVQRQQLKLQNTDNDPYYLHLLSQKFTNYLPQKKCETSYSSNIQFLQSLICQTKDQDNLISEFGRIKSHRFLNLYALIFKELVNLIQSQKIGKVYNTIKHLMRFYLGVLFDFSQIYFLGLYFQKNVDIASKFLREYLKRKSINSASRSYIKSSFQKFKDYQSRFEQKRQRQTAQLFEKYKDEYSQTSSFHELFNMIERKLNDFYYQNQKRNLEADSQIQKEKIKSLIAPVSQNLSNLKKIVNMVASKTYFTRFFDQQQAIEVKYYKNKFKLLIYLILYLNSQNFQTVESIILPNIQLNQQYHIKEKDSQKSKRNYNQQNELCEYSLEILKDYSKQIEQINLDSISGNCCYQQSKQHRKKA